MAKPGPKTDLTPELFKEIERAILAGNNLKQTAECIEIDPQKLYNWNYDNYLEIADKIDGWQRDRKLIKANRNIEEILDLPRGDKDFTKTVSDMSKFVAETLDKKHYSKRTENTGADGDPLTVTVINYGKDNPTP